MRRICYGSSNVKIFCDIPIRFLQEIYFASLIKAPQIFFKDPAFSNYILKENYIEIDLSDWSNFIWKVSSAFRNDSERRKQIIKNILLHLNAYEKKLEKSFKKYQKTGHISRSEVATLFEDMSNVDAFAIFNMLIPTELYDKLLYPFRNKDNSLSIDSIMFCPIVPHRILLRQEKLKLALLTKQQKIQDIDIDNFINNFIFYEDFENWIFNIQKIEDPSLLKREISKMCSLYTENEIKQELKNIQKYNKLQSEKYFFILDYLQKQSLPEDLFDAILFFPYIVFEEEKRHMIECKHLALLGMIFKKENIDPARNSIVNILKEITL